MALFFHSIAGLVIAECACASLIFTSFIDFPSLVCVDPFELVHFFQRFSIHSFIHSYVGKCSWLGAVDESFAFVGADFHAVSSICFLQSFSELLEFFSAS